MLERWWRDHRVLVTVEEGTVVNGFGAYLAGLLQVRHSAGPRGRALGVPDRLVEHAPRADQLEVFGLTAGGIARRLRALHARSRVEAR